MPTRERNAPLGWGVVGPRHVHENGAASSPHAWALVVIEHDQHVIEPIGAPKPLSAFGIGMLHQPVVVAVGRGITPAVIGAHRLDGQGRAWMPDPIGTIKDAAHAPGSCRRCTVTLALAHAHPGASEGARKRQLP